MISINANAHERALFREGAVLRVWKISPEQEHIYFEECPLPAATPEPSALIKVLERIADALEQVNYRNLQRDVNGR